MEPMTLHEKECAFAAIGALIEKAQRDKDRARLRELRAWLKEIEAVPVER